MPLDSQIYHLPTPELWKGRKDTSASERFFQTIQCMRLEDISKIQDKHIFLLGFASDAGILRNQGRPGAKLGPDALKSHLGKLPFHGNYPCVDLGNIYCEGDNLEKAQSAFGEAIKICHQKDHITIGLGGGHEIALAHYLGLQSKAPGIINFDAHFDLRPWKSPELGTSGTPFSQISALCEKNQIPFDYCCLGIQPQGNTHTLFEQARQNKVSFLTAENMVEMSLEKQKSFLDDFLKKHQQIYLSICLDVLAAAFAPGVSAPQPLGLSPLPVLVLLKYILQTGKVIGLDIAELSPPLDENEQTAKLAAMITAEIIANIRE